MITFPHCKINLGLHILARRADGYHDLDTCFYPVPWTDILEVIPSDEETFSSTGIKIPGDTVENLCLKAYRLLKRDFTLPPVKIHLHKTIPIGAGLGGGSSDASYTLKLLRDIFKLELSQQQLQVYASQLGSDCSFFIQQKPMLGSGRGDVLTDIDLNLKGYFLVVIKPDVHISTAEAYAGVTPFERSVNVRTILENHPLTEWSSLLVNDFEKSVFRKHPELKSIKETLLRSGAEYASMSGSGSAIFGIFKSSPANLREQFPGMTYWVGQL